MCTLSDRSDKSDKSDLHRTQYRLCTMCHTRQQNTQPSTPENSKAHGPHETMCTLSDRSDKSDKSDLHSTQYRLCTMCHARQQGTNIEGKMASPTGFEPVLPG